MEAKLHLQLTYEQIVDIVSQLSPDERNILFKTLGDKENTEIVDEAFVPYILSEKSLAKDWLSPEEDEAWKNL